MQKPMLPLITLQYKPFRIFSRQAYIAVALPFYVSLAAMSPVVQAGEAASFPPRTNQHYPQKLALDSTQVGNTIAINGSVLPIPWIQVDGKIAIADYALTDHFGATFLNTEDPTHQPVWWFSGPHQPPVNLRAWLDSGYRFLDVTEFFVQQGWAVTPQNHILQITYPPSQLQAIRQETHPWGERLIIDVTGATLTQLSEGVDEFSLSLHATVASQIIQRLPTEFSGTTGITALGLDAQIDRTILTVQTGQNVRPIITTLANPHRVVVDIRRDFLQPLNIVWAPGLRWRQQYISVAGKSFPVYWLQLDPRQENLSLHPIWTDPTRASGIAPLATMAQRWQAAAAINAGFFNRNNQYPLGAMRFDGTWISGPILSRGVLGWDTQGNAIMRRLFLNQTLTTTSGESFPIQAINSGFVQAGLGLYTPSWGPEYRPILDSEIVVSVLNGQVLNQQQVTSEQVIPIPSGGYLLALRSFERAARSLPPGTAVDIQSQLLPKELAPFPHIAGGGPLLLQNSSVVLNAEAEQFSSAFARQAAPRSAIGLTSSNELLLVAVHDSPSGPGPTLVELAQIMAQLGSTDALNLDGGSSASLYLGGRLLNRSPRTAARVNNGIGLFLE